MLLSGSNPAKARSKPVSVIGNKSYSNTAKLNSYVYGYGA